jgi:hypothetical protein
MEIWIISGVNGYLLLADVFEYSEVFSDNKLKVESKDQYEVSVTSMKYGG